MQSMAEHQPPRLPAGAAAPADGDAAPGTDADAPAAASAADADGEWVGGAADDEADDEGTLEEEEVQLPSSVYGMPCTRLAGLTVSNAKVCRAVGQPACRLLLKQRAREQLSMLLRSVLWQTKRACPLTSCWRSMAMSSARMVASGLLMMRTAPMMKARYLTASLFVEWPCIDYDLSRCPVLNPCVCKDLRAFLSRVRA